MLAEAIKYVSDLAVKGAALTTHKIDGDPERLIVARSGTYEILPVPYSALQARPRRLHVETFAAFGEAYRRLGATAPTAPTGEVAQAKERRQDATLVAVQPLALSSFVRDQTPVSTVWVNQRELKFFLDEADRREHCRVGLKTSEVWETLKQFDEPVGLDHKQLVRLLRHDLANVVDPSILAAFRSLDMQAMQRAVSVQQHGKQSLDAAVSSQVVGGDKPEGFVCRFAVFANLELRGFYVHVPLTVDIDAAAGRITLEAVPEALNTALDDSLENAAARIAADLPPGTVILRGTPE